MKIEEEVRIEFQLTELMRQIKELCKALERSIHIDVSYFDGEAYPDLHIFPKKGNRRDFVSKCTIEESNILGIIREVEKLEQEGEDEKY